MKVYTNYVNGYDTAIQTLSQARKDKEKFAKFLASREEIPECPIANIEMVRIVVCAIDVIIAADSSHSKDPRTTFLGMLSQS